MSNLRMVREDGVLFAVGDDGFKFPLEECDCGWPQMHGGRDHAPTCSLERSSEDAEEAYEDYLYGGGEWDGMTPDLPADDTCYGPDAHLVSAYEDLTADFDPMTDLNIDLG